jgi:hypothetical protein
MVAVDDETIVTGAADGIIRLMTIQVRFGPLCTALMLLNGNLCASRLHSVVQAFAWRMAATCGSCQKVAATR